MNWNITFVRPAWDKAKEAYAWLASWVEAYPRLALGVMIALAIKAAV